MATLPEMLRAERIRCQALLRDFAVLGSSGAFAAALIGESIHAADDAVRNGNMIAMQRALDRLRRFEDVKVAPPASRPHRAVTAFRTGRWAQPPRWSVPNREVFFTYDQRRVA